jgi:hypothetical protein
MSYPKMNGNKHTSGTMGVFNILNWVSCYLLVGGLTLFVMDYVVTKIADLKDDPSRKFTNMERIIILLLWPIYGWVFWFNFIRAFFGRKD